mmetsp:Transcript_15415/g.50988  ORF Transcript_15415/g.50988 Transcript_15415/m.50988 type:complete len:368 (+) Transcript_15415:729-1832(+)
MRRPLSVSPRTPSHTRLSSHRSLSDTGSLSSTGAPLAAASSEEARLRADEIQKSEALAGARGELEAAEPRLVGGEVGDLGECDVRLTLCEGPLGTEARREGRADVVEIALQEAAILCEEPLARVGARIGSVEDHVGDRFGKEAEVLWDARQSRRLLQRDLEVIRRARGASGTPTSRAIDERIVAVEAGSRLYVGRGAERWQMLALVGVGSAVAEALPPVAHRVMAKPAVAARVARRLRPINLHLIEHVLGQDAVREEAMEELLKVVGGGGDAHRELRILERRPRCRRHVERSVQILGEEGINLEAARRHGHRPGKLQVAGEVGPRLPWLGAVRLRILVEAMRASEELLALVHAEAAQRRRDRVRGIA